MEAKKYQVFISSTYTDLIEERRNVLDILLMADCIPAGMEAFVATDTEQFQVIKKVIDLCDYYVLIIGKRYGSISHETGRSYTEMEYDYAIEQGIPVLVFALDESVELSADKMDSDPEKIAKLKAFRERAMTNRITTVWRTPADLAGCLAVAIMKAKIEMQRPGWQRGVDFDEGMLRRDIMTLQSVNEQLEKENEKKQQIIDSLMEQSNLAFEGHDITFEFYYIVKKSSGPGASSKKVSDKKSIPLTEIFKVAALEMLNVSVSEYGIEQVIKEKLFSEYNTTVYFGDTQIIKKILNQFKALGLIVPKWTDKALYWHLSKKGEKVRDDMTLIHNDKKE